MLYIKLYSTCMPKQQHNCILFMPGCHIIPELLCYYLLLNGTVGANFVSNTVYTCVYRVLELNKVLKY